MIYDFTLHNPLIESKMSRSFFWRNHVFDLMDHLIHRVMASGDAEMDIFLLVLVQW